jgi:hypothetical protein
MQNGSILISFQVSIEDDLLHWLILLWVSSLTFTRLPLLSSTNNYYSSTFQSLTITSLLLILLPIPLILLCFPPLTHQCTHSLPSPFHLFIQVIILLHSILYTYSHFLSTLSLHYNLNLLLSSLFFFYWIIIYLMNHLFSIFHYFF